MNAHIEEYNDRFSVIVKRVFLALALVWSLAVPTLVALLASRGFSTGLVAIDESPSNVIRWLSVFLLAASEAAFVMWFTTTALSLIDAILFEFSRDNWKLRCAFEATAGILLVVDFCCATFVAGFAPELLSHYGFAIGVAACSTHLGAALLFVSAFVAAFALGAMLLVLLTGTVVAGVFIFGLYQLLSLAMKSCW